MKMRVVDKAKGISTNVNILRFVAALLVIICHSYAITGGQLDPWQRFTGGQSNFGGLAVAIFFFLSGFYTTKSLYRVKQPFTFMKKRCERLFPQLWITVLLCIFILGPCVTSLSIVKYLTSPGTYLYLLNGVFVPIHSLPGVFLDGIYDTVNGPLWTMPVEFLAYIGLAIIYRISMTIGKKNGTSRVQRILHIVSVIGLLAMFIGVERYVEPNGFLGTVIRPMIFFFIGSLFWDYSDKILLDWKLGIITFLLFLLSSGFGYFNVGAILFLPYAILSLTLVIKQIHTRTTFFHISYEMYLVGWPIQQVLFMISGNQMSVIANIILTVPLDIAIGWGIFKLVEALNKGLRTSK